MTVLFEFLGNEPIENVITCMNFNIDKVIFFGYHNVIEHKRASTELFLKKYCGVKKVVFWELSQDDLQSIIKTMQAEIEREIARDSRMYFDITGGESLILVAFGILAVRFNTPMHVYDVVNNKLTELDDCSQSKISNELEVKRITFNLDQFIELQGGMINNFLHKELKNIENNAFTDDVAKIWEVAKRHWSLWNPFSDFLKRHMIPNENLYVSRRASVIVNKLRESDNKLDTPNKLNRILDDLSEMGAIKKLKHIDGRYEFSFKNEQIKDLLWEGGSILELHTYQRERKKYDDCRIGVHLDWDGVIQDTPSDDVINEIDVLALKGNVLVFISCKSGKMNAQQSLHALYELDCVAKRFGGKYARMVLVTAQPMSAASMLRAKEMNIEVLQ